MRLLALLLCFALASTARIVEMPHFEHLPQYLDEKTLLVLDIDDTLLVPKQMLGCDEWFQRRLKMHQTNHDDNFKKALDLALAEWEGVRHLTEMEIVEPGLEKIVHHLQQKSISLIGLTTQSLTLSKRTSHQLMNHHMDLSLTAPTQRAHYVSVEDHEVLFKNGILFTDATHKGKAFFAFCDAIGYQPKRIVFVNDKESHLREMETEADKRNIEFIGCRYGFSDARKQAFSHEIAEFQFHNSSFHRILSDEEAKEKMGYEEEES